jgi:hypothetical protein
MFLRKDTNENEKNLSDVESKFKKMNIENFHFPKLFCDHEVKNKPIENIWEIKFFIFTKLNSDNKFLHVLVLNSINQLFLFH